MANQSPTAVRFTLGFVLTIEELAELLSKTNEQVVELWDNGLLGEAMVDFNITDILDVVGDDTGDLYVGNGLF